MATPTSATARATALTSDAEPATILTSEAKSGAQLTTTLTSKATTSYHSHSFPEFTTIKNLGPLTTSISFPTGCYTNLIDMNRDGLGPSGAWKTLGCAMSTCCPSGNFYSEEWAWMTSYYSPGFCPSDYQSCSPPTQSGLRLTAREGERIVFCCPNNCICPNYEDMPSIAPGACGSRLTVSGETTVYTVMNNFRDQIPEATVPYEFEPGFTQEVQIAWPIQIRVPETTTTQPSGSSSGKGGDGLSTGTIIGIAFGGFFSVFIACLATYLLLRRRRSHPREEDAAPEMQEERPETPYSPAPAYGPQGLYVQRKPVPQQYANVDDGAPYEMPSTSPNAVIELPEGEQWRGI